MSQDVDYMQEAASAAHARLPDNSAFLLLVVPGSNNTQVRYGSNVERKAAIKILKETLFRFGEQEDWMRHIE